MNFKQHQNQLSKLPGGSRKVNLKELIEQSKVMGSNNASLDALIGASFGTTLLIKYDLNISDAIVAGYAGQYPDMSETKSLYQKLLEEQGDTDGLQGLVSGIKGKVFEVELEDKLEALYPGFDFEIGKNANQPIWDLKGIAPDGQEILVQAKMTGSYSASEIMDRMTDNPDVLFAVSNEVREKILKKAPELANQFVPIDVSSADFTEEVESGLEQLLANAGIDIPDDAADMLPFVGEIVIGLRVLYEMSTVKRDFNEIKVDEKRRIQGLRAIMALSRFGVAAVCTMVGGVALSAIFPGIGTLLGALGGAIAGAYINKNIKPHMHKYAMYLLDMTDEDLIYFKNKVAIDGIAERFYSTRIRFGLA
jgi:hypothetical protein